MNILYGYQMQGYTSGGSDVTSEELNHRNTKKCTGFPWLKEETRGREGSRKKEISRFLYLYLL